MTSMLTQSLASHKDLLRVRTEQIDHLNTQIQEFSNMQKHDLQQLQELKERVRTREERQAKIANLKRSIAEKKRQASLQQQHSSSPPAAGEIEPPWLSIATITTSAEMFAPTDDGSMPTGSPMLPSPPTLQAYLAAYTSHTSSLQKQAEELKSRSAEVEAMYRKVVSLCTGVEETKVEELLPSMVAAVESERGGLGVQEVGRVREFLRRVDGVQGAVDG